MNILPRRNLGPGEDWGRYVEGVVADQINEEESQLLFARGDNRSGVAALSGIADQNSLIQDIQNQSDVLLDVLEGNQSHLDTLSLDLTWREAILRYPGVETATNTGFSVPTSWSTATSVSFQASPWDERYSPNTRTFLSISGAGAFSELTTSPFPSEIIKVETRILVNGAQQGVYLPASLTLNGQYKFCEIAYSGYVETPISTPTITVELQFRASLALPSLSGFPSTCLLTVLKN